MLLPALGIFVVGYTDNILTARAFAGRTHSRVHNNQEFLAMGTANVGSSLVGGFPVSSSASRTVIAEASGARSQLYSLVAALLVLVSVLAFGGLIAAFPSAALGGLVIYAAIRLIDVDEFRRLWSFRRREFLLAVFATAGVLLFDILYGVLAAVAISVVELLTRVARPHAAVLGQSPEVAGWHDVDDYPGAAQVPGLVVFRYDSPLFFANAEHFVSSCLEALAGGRAAGTLVPAQHGGQHRDRHHRRRRAGGGARALRGGARRPGPRPGQARTRRRPRRPRRAGQDRRGPGVSDAADRGGCLRGVGGAHPPA